MDEAAKEAKTRALDLLQQITGLVQKDSVTVEECDWSMRNGIQESPPKGDFMACYLTGEKLISVNLRLRKKGTE